MGGDAGSKPVDVFRLVKTSDTRFYSPAAREPLAMAFEPSSVDKSRAQQTGDPVRLSVWDVERTTVEQGRLLFSTGAKSDPFVLSVAAVEAVQYEDEPPRLLVVRDLIDSIVGPGADGHCGIEGLENQ